MLLVLRSLIIKQKLRILFAILSITLGVAGIFSTLVMNASKGYSFATNIDNRYNNRDITVTFSRLENRNIARKNVASIDGIEDVTYELMAYSYTPERFKDLVYLGVDVNASIIKNNFPLINGRMPHGHDEVALTKRMADLLHLKVGSIFHVPYPSGTKNKTVVGLIKDRNQSQFAVSFLLMPLLTVQKEFNLNGYVNRSEIRVAKTANVAVIERSLKEKIGTRSVFYSSHERTSVPGGNKAGNGISFGMVFFSSISLFVGTFLIFNTFNLIVTEQTRLLGMFRIIGANRKYIRRLVISLAMFLGFVGSVAGLITGLGFSIAVRYLGKIFLNEAPVKQLQIIPVTMLLPIGIGMFATIVAALLPAYRAGKTSPLMAIFTNASKKNNIYKRYQWEISIVLFIISLASIAFITQYRDTNSMTPPIGMIGIIFFFSSLVISFPKLMTLLISLLNISLKKLLPGNIALTQVSIIGNYKHISTTASAIIVTATIIVSVLGLNFSMLESKVIENKQAYPSDFTIEPNHGSIVGFTPDIARKVRSIEGVKKVAPMSLNYIRFVKKNGNVSSIALIAIDLKTFNMVDKLKFVRGSINSIRAKFDGGGVLVAERFALKSGLGIGSYITNLDPDSTKNENVLPPKLRIIGIVKNDPTLGGVSVFISRKFAAKYFDVNLDTKVLIEKGSLNSQLLKRHIESTLTNFPQLTVIDQRTLKSEVWNEISNQSLVPLIGTSIIAMVICILGLTNTLFASIFERKREIGILRAIGVTKKQIQYLILFESAFVCVTASVFGILGGTGMVYWIMRGLNVAALQEGYSLVFYMPIWIPIIGLAVSILIGTGAGIYPSRVASNNIISSLVRYE